MESVPGLISRLDQLAFAGPARIEALVQKPAVGVHVRVSDAAVEAGLGLVGDHRQKDWWKGKRIPEREVTMVSAEVLSALGASPETPGDNLVVAGIDLRSLKPGQLVRIGSDVVLRRAVKDHRPCHLFARRISSEAREAVSEGGFRGALFAVLKGGTIRVGDTIHIET
jgi:MOSC domain-containing protein YiiM